MDDNAAADVPRAQHRRVVVPRAAGEGEQELAPVSWTQTALRLWLEPDRHPWEREWKLRRRAPLLLLVAALALLLGFFASGCATVPAQSIQQSAEAPAPSKGAHCESVLVSQEVQVPPEGEVADLRLTVRGIPPVLGSLKVLVRRPRFGGTLELESEEPPAFGKVLQVAGQQELTVVLARPPGAPGEWPRPTCRACRVEVELTGLFGAREGFDTFFAQATQEALAIEAAFQAQSGEPTSRPSLGLQRLASELQGEGRRCGVPLGAVLSPVLAALEKLDAARARIYGPDPGLPDALAVLHSWDAAVAALDDQPAAAAAARAAGWPASLRKKSRLQLSVQHLELSAQAFELPAPDRAIAARWIAVAMAQDPAALDQRAALLPPLRDLADAEARLAWVDPRSEVPLPGSTEPLSLRIRQWHAVRHGRKCIGPGGAVPLRDANADALTLASLFGADAHGRMVVAQPSQVLAARAGSKRAAALLCEPPSADIGPLLFGLEDAPLGTVAERLRALFAATAGTDDAVSRAALARASDLLCKIFDGPLPAERASSVTAYQKWADGGAKVLEVLPGPLVCGGRTLTAREIRHRLREAWRGALDRHAINEQLCPLRGGKCPEETAASVRRLFRLASPALAAPASADSAALDFPPPFGFTDEWVHKLDRCARETCDALAKLRREAPAGQFEGAVCPAPQADDRPQEVRIERPESPTAVTLSSCDAHAGVRLALRRAEAAGTLLAIASAHAFRFGSESVVRLGHHPQLGRIFERVADLTDPADVPRRADGAFEVALTPSVANQVFYFSSLRRRDY